jgi:hypothetical protein
VHASFLLPAILLLTSCLDVEAQECNPSGVMSGTNPPPRQCNRENHSECCVEGKMYTTYQCSPPMSSQTKAILTLNIFEEGGDGGNKSQCDEEYHSNDTLVVALSTGRMVQRKGQV